MVTRFSPSPSGHLHIGGARTVIFNWVLARKHGGQFILRVEDTDQARSTGASMRGILEDIAWLGLDWDQGPDPNDPDGSQIGNAGPYFQSRRLDIYQRHVQRLLDAGDAYRCFKTAEQLAEERRLARAEKRNRMYDPTEARSLTTEQIAAFEAEGRPYVVRFHMPDRDITVHDAIHGEVRFQAAELEDFVIQRSNGFPTFHLANVVDDALMGVTLVLRGVEHLMNTPKHRALQEALGFEPPQYAHMSLTLNPDGSKLSKRDKAKVARAAAKRHLEGVNDPDAWIEHLIETRRKYSKLADPPDPIETPEDIRAFIDGKIDAVHTAELIAHDLKSALPEIDVRDFRESGYLPEAVVNYVSLLGWSPKGDIEKFDLGYLRQNFDLTGMGKANSQFDRQKLLAFNADAIRELSPDAFRRRLFKHGIDFFEAEFGSEDDPRFKLFATAYHERSRTLADPRRDGAFFFKGTEEITYDPKVVKKVLSKNDGEGLAVLGELRAVLNECAAWAVAPLAVALDGYAEEKGLGMGKIAQPLRVAVSGATVSPPIHETLVILGRGEVLARINRCLMQAERGGVASGES